MINLHDSDATLPDVDTASQPPSLTLAPALSADELEQEAQLKLRWVDQKKSALLRWTMLRMDELEAIGGHTEPLIELICERYVLPRADVEKQVQHFLDNYISIVPKDPYNGRWEELAAIAKGRWNKLHINELIQTKGNKQTLVNLVRRRYAVTPEEARKQVTQFVAKCTYELSRPA